MSGNLYVVATPIGNSEDITDRARRVLSEVSLVAAEDTRMTQKLFNILGIKNKTIANHKFNEKKQCDYFIQELLQGRDVAIVSDAGTPCISDPGHILVQSAVENQINVIGVCGASSVITALSVSGFQFLSFAFYGFFPRENKEIRKTLERIKNSEIATSVFLESPKRIEKMLQVLLEVLPKSELCLCNDLTKMHEKIYRGQPEAVLQEIIENPSADKGEYTLVIQKPDQTEEEMPEEGITPEAILIDYIVKHNLTMKESIQELQKIYKGKISKKEFYSAMLHLKEMLPHLFSQNG